MLQKIDSMEWKTPRVGVLGTDFDNPVISADYDGTSLFIGEKDRPVLYVNFPDGVVLAQEVPAPADPFVPDAEVRAALSLLIDAGNLLGAEDGEHFRTAARTVHAWLYGAQ